MRRRVCICIFAAAVAVCAIAVAQQSTKVNEPRIGSVDLSPMGSRIIIPPRALLIPWHVNYQGYLTDNSGVPVDDTLSIRFSIWDAASAGTELWNETQSVPVENGIFNVMLGELTQISSDIFQTGASRWLELEIAAQPLTPRTEIASVAYAYKALRADTADYASNAVADNDWTVTGSVLYPAGQYGLAMSSSSVLYGLEDSTHANLGVSCTTGTSGQNYAYSAVGGGLNNAAGGDYATVGGGQINAAHGAGATVGGGYNNSAGGMNATVGGGGSNSASGNDATVSGGSNNVASGMRASVGGGSADTVAGDYSFAAGRGVRIAPGADYTFAFGRSFTTSTPNAVIFHDSNNPIVVGIGTTAPTERLDVNGTVQMTGFSLPTGAASGYVLTSDASGQGNWQAAAGDNDWVITGNVMFANGNYGLGMRSYNVFYGIYDSTHVNFGIQCTTGISGFNRAFCTVSGGYRNSAGYDFAAVGGGSGNDASGYHSTIGGGENNTAAGQYATASGGRDNTLSGDGGTVAGGGMNTVGAGWASIGGGWDNSVTGNLGVVAGGESDSVKGHYSGALAGYGNLAGDDVLDTAAVVVGGWRNSATDKYCSVGGGGSNTASNLGSTVGGGINNTASGFYSTVAGGFGNSCAGADGFAATSSSTVLGAHSSSAAFNGQTTTMSGETVVGHITKSTGTFTIDHPLEPTDKILNHYFAESPEMVLIYRGVAHIGGDGRAVVRLPDYFEALNRNPMVQLTGVGTSDVYVAAEVEGNSFVIGGKPGTKVYWTVTGDRKDQSAEIARTLKPVEQVKDGGLAGRSLDDEYLSVTMMQLERMGEGGRFQFRTASGRERYEALKRR